MSSDRKFPTEIIDLPSHGWFYDEDSPLSSGQIELKYMTAKEEDILTSTNLIQKGVALDMLLDALVISDVDVDDLLVGDKNAIMVAARILGYGKQYDISITCPNCQTQQGVEINLTDLDEKEVSEPKEKGQNSFEYTFDRSGTKIEYRFLTSKIEKEVDKELIEMAKLKINKGIDRSLSTRMKYIVTSVDGDTTQKAIRDFVDNMLARDARQFRDFYQKALPGLDFRFDFSCRNCPEERRMTVPLGINFFWPDSTV